jgi:AraC-like DNA-binding protein
VKKPARATADTPNFVFRYKHGCPLGRIVMIGESHGVRRKMAGLRQLGYYALVYLFDGHGIYQDAGGRKRTLSGGDCFLLFPDVPHHYVPSGDMQDWCEFYIVFEGPEFDLWRREGLLMEDDCFFRLEPAYLWLKRFREVVDMQAIPSPFSSLADLCRLQLLLADIQGHQAQALIGDDESAWLQRAYALIEAQVPGSPDFRAMARELGVSYDVFRRRFARLSGHSPGQYHLIRLMDRASSLLCKTRMTNAEIARELGICNEFYFSRMFAKVTGLSPRRFRTKFQQSF